MTSHVSLVTFIFDDFKNLPSDPGSATYSHEVTDANDNKWKLAVYPGGESEAPTTTEGEERPMDLLFWHGKTTNLDVRYVFIIRNRKGSVVREDSYKNIIEKGTACDGYIMTRSEVLDETSDILVEGSLHIECLIQIRHVKNFFGAGHFYLPPNPVAMDVVDFVTDQSVARFSIGQEEYRLHKHILSARAPILANMCEGCNKDKLIPLPNITSEVFGIIIRYIYGYGDGPQFFDILNVGEAIIIAEKGKAIINAADYFGIEDLKMVTETALVASRIIRFSTVADWLLFADTKTCPLLKEYAMAYITARPRDVLESESFLNLEDSPRLLKEIIFFMHQKLTSNGDNDNIRSFTVDALRRKLSEKGLDVYGSKEALMSRLEESNKRKRDDE